MKAVLDSSVLVSAFLSPTGTPAQLFSAGSEGAFTICVSETILDETERALLRPALKARYRYSTEEVARYLALVSRASVIAGDVPSIEPAARDPADDAILACAVAADAAYLVTGDDDLLSLIEHRGICIVTPRQFLALL